MVRDSSRIFRGLIPITSFSHRSFQAQKERLRFQSLYRGYSQKAAHFRTLTSGVGSFAMEDNFFIQSGGREIICSMIGHVDIKKKTLSFLTGTVCHKKPEIFKFEQIVVRKGIFRPHGRINKIVLHEGEHDLIFLDAQAESINKQTKQRFGRHGSSKRRASRACAFTSSIGRVT